MNLRGISRREWLLYSSAATMARAVAGPQHEHSARSGSFEAKTFQFFTGDEAADVESIAALIIPSDETPGAREAGVIHFIDAALATFDQDKQSIYRAGLERIHEEVRAIASHARHVADLHAEQQMQLMDRIATTEFFGTIRTHTVMGFFGAPARGGNRDEVGWKLIGFEDQFTFQPPFGYYDSGVGNEPAPL